MIEYNRKLTKSENLPFGINHKVLDAILVNFRFKSDMANPRFRVSRVVSTVLAGIVTKKPFKSVNLPSGLVLIIDFLNDNGFDLSIRDIDKLQEIIEDTKQESEIRSDIESFLLKNLKQKG